MECKNCGATWNAKKEISKPLAACPFCGDSLAAETVYKFYNNTKDALTAIMSQFGADVLLGKLTSHLPDFAPTVSVGDKRLVYAVYELGAAQTLKNNLNASSADKAIAIKIAKQKLVEAHVAPNSAETIIKEFTAALGWKTGIPAPQAHATQKQTHPPATPQTQTPPVDIATLIINGETRNLQFGEYKWRVLETCDGRALILTEDIIGRRPYNAQFKNTAWEECTLRQYLNGELLRKFKSEEQEQIAETKIANPDNLWYGTPGGNDKYDKIFLLSLEEADRYFGDSGDYLRKRRKSYATGRYTARIDAGGEQISNGNDGDRIAKEINGRFWWWWLRSPGRTSDSASCVYADGSIYAEGRAVTREEGGIRPALWLQLSAGVSQRPQ